jgi:fructose transport system ATP-binding protein
VFRQGRIVGELDTDKTSGNEVISLITGVNQGGNENKSYI